MKKRGISLIVLIVTIIVIIILAAVVILTISKNNPIESAKEASFSKKYEGKFVIKNDELMYNEDMIQQEKDWCKSLNVKGNIKTGAEKAKDDPQNYYGAKVDYKTGNEDIDKDITEWKIFYSDGSNVYIISSGYVDPSNLPEKDGAKPDCSDPTNYPKAARFNNILGKYNGSSDITDEKMKAFNSDYFKERINEETGETYVYSSDYGNMKSVAYMLDRDIWNNFTNDSVAEYAVGGPSVEMTLESYSQKNNKDYRAKASNACGYVTSKDGGIIYAKYDGGMLSSSEDLYVLPQNTGADAMWLSSPSVAHSRYMMYVSYYGAVNAQFNTGTTVGFRPLVCLSSNILLTRNEVTGDCEISQ